MSILLQQGNPFKTHGSKTKQTLKREIKVFSDQLKMVCYIYIIIIAYFNPAMFFCIRKWESRQPLEYDNRQDRYVHKKLK